MRDLYLYACGKHPGLSPPLTIEDIDKLLNELNTQSITDERFDQINNIININGKNISSIAAKIGKY